MVDSPRFSAPLVKKIESLGGIAQIFLTHRDDIADHALFAERFGVTRTMHTDDGAARFKIEQIVEGVVAVHLDNELTVVPVPGHTPGSMVLLYQNKFLFNGDHLAWSPNRKSLVAFRGACWYSWAEQTRSVEKLLGYDFEWILPGPGRTAGRTPTEMRQHLKHCDERIRKIR